MNCQKATRDPSPHGSSRRVKARLAPAGRLLVLAIGFVALATGALTAVVRAAGPAGSGDSRAADRAVTSEGQTYTLELRADRLAVRFLEGLSPQDRDAAIARHALLSTAAARVDLPAPRLAIFELPPGTGAGQLVPAAEVMRTDRTIAGVHFVYRSFGIDLIDTGELFVQLRADVDPSWLRDRAAGLGVEIVSPTAWREGNFLARVTRQSAPDAIAACEILRAFAEIEYAEPNFVRRLKPFSTPDDPLFGDQWGLHNDGAPWPEDADVDAPEGWEIEPGASGVTIAILDEGCDMTHPDYASSLVGGWDFPGNDNDPSPNSWDGHGTACAGVAAALTDNGLGVAGVAGSAGIMPIRIAYSPSSGSDWVTTDQWLSDAIAWAYANGADVLSNSWGGGPPSAQIHAAIRDAVVLGRGGLGAIVLFAAGNNNSSPPEYPAIYPETIAVAATSPCDERKSPASCDGESWGSNYGPGVDVAAPGVKIPTTDIQGSGGYNTAAGAAGDYFMTFNGTSSATPHVAGLAALVVAQYPAYQGTEIRTRLEQTCDKVGGYGYDAATGISNELGHGRVNAYRALSGKPQVALGPSPAHPSVYRDAGDAKPPYPAAIHASAAYEWLGEEYSPERDADDVTDPDGPANNAHRDGFDDGVTFYPPYFPGDTGTVSVRLSVEDSQSSRYAAGPLYVNIWFDWQADDDWNNTYDWVVQNMSVDPSAWGGANSDEITVSFIVPDAPIGWHIGSALPGRFLNIRTRLTYDQPLSTASEDADWGEVEDDYFLNFVEMFSLRLGYMELDQNCIAWDYYDGAVQPWTCHPGFRPDDLPNGYVCAEVYNPSYTGDDFAVLRTPSFDLTEFTTAYLRFEHSGVEMTTGQVHLYKNGVLEAGLRLYNDPLLTPPCAPVLTEVIDLTPWCGDGNGNIRIEFVTLWGDPCGSAFPNYQDWKIDNVIVIGVDEIAPDAVVATTVPTGPTTTTLTWIAPGDDGALRRAELYNTRYAPDPITQANWRHALWVRPDMVAVLPVPAPPGSTEALAIARLESGLHYFSVRTLDEVTHIGATADAGLNHPPDVNAPDLVTATAGDLVSFDVAADDPDFDALLLLAPQLPGASVFTDHGNGQGTLEWLTDAGDVGTHTARFEARDWNGATGHDTTVVVIDALSSDVTGDTRLAGVNRLETGRPTVFHDRTWVNFELARAVRADLSVYDVAGRRVRRLVEDGLTAGRHAVAWDGRDAAGRPLSGGVYFVRLRIPGLDEARPVVLLR